MVKKKRTARQLPVLPLKNTVVFPHVVVPLAVAAQLDENVEEAAWEEVHHVGTVVRVEHMIKLPDGTVQLAVRGLERVRLAAVELDRPYLVARVRSHPEEPGGEQAPLEREALSRSAIASFQQLVAIAPYLPGELLGAALSLDDHLQLAYFLATHVRLSVEDRQQILELPSAQAKLERLLGLMAHELEVLELGRKIQSQAEESIGRSQREYFLREQLKAIQQELGELDQDAAETADLRKRTDRAGLPAEARREADRELARLERIPSISPESSVIRTYLDLLVSLPWNVSTEGELDVKRARQILDADHYDLDKVKKRIVEHLAVRRLKQERGLTERGREPILCFVGPPGVGKPAPGQAIPRAIVESFARASLGGVH